ncbi:phospholipase C type enzyme [Microbotryomycetes sp. JL201]|nr:phospholipase C type enzyme [Microbotryomycetes sp. JL201]
MLADDHVTPLASLRVLSLNCWGLKYVAHKRRQRLLAIADWIASTGTSRSSTSSSSSGSSPSRRYDIIALQEVWVRQDFDVIAARAREAGLVHSRFFYSGAIGSGLAILSAHPITSSFIYPYPLNGFPLHFIEGDFFAGKSACGITVDVPDVGLVDVLNSHMFAPGGEGEQVGGAHRVAQAWELAKIVQEKSERGRFVIVTGDFNSQPQSIIMRMLLHGGTLQDAWAETHPSPPSIDSAAHRQLTPQQIVHKHGITCDSPLNTYSAAKLAKRSPRDETVIRGGKRLDYILYRSPQRSTNVLRATASAVTLTEIVPSLGVSYSDHFAIEATLDLVPMSAITSGPPGHPSTISTDDLSRALANLSSAYRHCLSNSTLQLRLFGLSLVLIPVLCIAASYQPLKALRWLFVVLAVADGACGATMLYTGFVGGNWEKGALRNVMAEMENELTGRR